MGREDLEKKVDLAFLSAFYGGMLTEHQRRILSLHCEEDLSLGEIAGEVGVSRQAVHEALISCTYDKETRKLIPGGVLVLCAYPGHPEGDRERVEMALKQMIA